MPDCIIQYRPTKEAAELLRNLMSESGSPNQCHIHVALMGSPYDSEGNDPAFLTNVRRAVEEALLAARAVRTQRKWKTRGKGNKILKERKVHLKRQLQRSQQHYANVWRKRWLIRKRYIHPATGLVTSKWNIICNVPPMARTKT
ncbi:uncharacterized protein [Montipora foliosa]|uniref:uncharacterized protein isoform X4 n=1 Tax=Montipora foliosa TaxID=591990 RepID=UPI0035F10D74